MQLAQRTAPLRKNETPGRLAVEAVDEGKFRKVGAGMP
jgi:hypothetical protein